MKNIILCADGTWNTPHGDSATTTDTNVRKLYMSLTNDPSQLKYYDSGVGTDGTPLDHLSGGAMGEGLFQKIQDCYQFLSDVYDPGDKIFLFGFSRGAFTARSIGGMIAGFGVPTINLDNMTVNTIFNAYRESDPSRKAADKASLKAAYDMQDVVVQMVGVWDTVGALGIPIGVFQEFNEQKYGFLDTSLHPCVVHAYHAICIDEQRKAFVPTLWTNSDGTDRLNDAQLEQAWFPGVHCDVGGSYQESQLSDIALSWMMHKAKENGLVFSAEAEAAYLAPPAADIMGMIHDSWKFFPYGPRVHREVPAIAAISNTVQLRLAADATYLPPNLTRTGTTLTGYSTAEVLPYIPVVPTGA
jgi:uncharacterized protein (DUF2235 family)